MDEKQLEIILDRMASKWTSEFVSRKKVEDFTGGLITGKTVANYESKGEGPPKVKLGRNSGYPKETFIEWLKTRLVPA